MMMISDFKMQDEVNNLKLIMMVFLKEHNFSVLLKQDYKAFAQNQI